MAIITIKTGGRGRPLKIDTEKALQSFLKSKDLAQARLQQIRQEAHGVRAESIVGSDLSLPSALEASYDVLQALRAGEQISYQTAKELRAGLLTMKQLASKQERVYGRALAKSIETEFAKSLESVKKYASAQAKEYYNKLIENFRKLTPQQKQKYFISKSYQDPRTNTRTGSPVSKTAIEWSKNDMAEKIAESRGMTKEQVLESEDAEIKQQLEFTGEEALAYIENDKLQRMEF